MKLKVVKTKDGQKRKVIRKCGNYLMVQPLGKTKVQGFDLIKEGDVCVE